MSRDTSIDVQSLVAGLSDPLLETFALACQEELAQRQITIAPDLGSTLTRTTAEVINPLLDPTSLPPSELADGRLVVVHSNRQVKLDGRIYPVSGIPYKSLAILSANAGKIVAKEKFFSFVWPERDLTEEDSNKRSFEVVRKSISRLKTDLLENGLGSSERPVIQYVRNIGWIGLESLSD